LNSRKGTLLYFKLMIMFNQSNRLPVKHSSRQSTSAHEAGKIFSFDHDTIVEVVLINGEPYFVAADVCRALGLVNVTDRINTSLDDDEHLPYQINRAGQQRTVNVISESGLYALIVRSTKPNARKFRKWITSEVLPAIRKTGNYSKSLPGDVLRSFKQMDCIVLFGEAQDGTTRRLCMYYDSAEPWFNQSVSIDCANIMQSHLKQIALFDKNTQSCRTEWYRLNSNTRQPAIRFGETESSKHSSNPISECETAIEQYQYAKKRVKEAAKKVVESTEI
jgi:prophage antirepressor-like protein